MLLLLATLASLWAGPSQPPALAFPCGVILVDDSRLAFEHIVSEMRQLGADRLLRPLDTHVQVDFAPDKSALRFSAEVSRITGRARLIVKGTTSKVLTLQAHARMIWDFTLALNTLRRFESVFSVHRPVWDRETPRRGNLWSSFRDRRERMIADIEALDAEMYPIFEVVKQRAPDLELPRRDPGRFTVLDFIFDPFSIPGRDHAPNRSGRDAASLYGWRYHVGWTRLQVTRIAMILSVVSFAVSLPSDARLAWTIYDRWDRLVAASDSEAAMRDAEDYHVKHIRLMGDRLLSDYAAAPAGPKREELLDSIFYLYEKEQSTGRSTFRGQPLEAFVQTHESPSAEPGSPP